MRLLFLAVVLAGCGAIDSDVPEGTDETSGGSAANTDGTTGTSGDESTGSESSTGIMPDVGEPPDGCPPGELHCQCVDGGCSGDLVCGEGYECWAPDECQGVPGSEHCGCDSWDCDPGLTCYQAQCVSSFPSLCTMAEPQMTCADVCGAEGLACALGCSGEWSDDSDMRVWWAWSSMQSCLANDPANEVGSWEVCGVTIPPGKVALRCCCSP